MSKTAELPTAGYKKKRVRKNVKDLTKEEKKVLVKCFLRLKHTPAPFPDSRGMSYYDYFVYIHMQNPPDNLFAHQGPHFGVWHRYFLLLLERALNEVKDSCDAEVSLPYWNWTEGASTLAIFNPNFFGTNGVGEEQTIRDSEFADPEKFPLNVHDTSEKLPKVIRRQFGSGISTIINNTLLTPVSTLDLTEPPSPPVGPSACPKSSSSSSLKEEKKEEKKDEKKCKKCKKLKIYKKEEKSRKDLGTIGSHAETENFSSVELPNPTQINILLARPVFDVQPFNITSNSLISFRNLHEGWRNFQNVRRSVMHNVVHLWVGGTMSLLSSPNDICFWTHHTFVDALYYSWQKLHPFISQRGVGETYNVRLTKVKDWRVEATEGSCTIELDEKFVSGDKPRCFNYYFAPGYYINVASDSPEAFTDSKGKSYESFVVSEVTPRKITFIQQMGQKTYTYNNIKKGRGYVIVVQGTLPANSKILKLIGDNGKPIKVKYIEKLRIGDRIAISSTPDEGEVMVKPMSVMHGVASEKPYTPAEIAPVSSPPAEQNFLATVVAFGEDGRSLVLDKTNDLGYTLTNRIVYRQSFYRGSTGSKRVYLGAHWGSNLDDFLVGFPDKRVPLRSLVKPDTLPYRYDLDLSGSVPTTST